MDAENPRPTPVDDRQSWDLADLVRECSLGKTVCHAHLSILQQYLELHLPVHPEAAGALQPLAALLKKWLQAYPGTPSGTGGPVPSRDAVIHWQDQLYLLDDLAMDLALRLLPKPDILCQAPQPSELTVPPAAGPGGTVGSLKGNFAKIAYLSILLGQTQVHAFPLWLIIDQNSVCNFKCKMCPAHAFGIKYFPGYFAALDKIRAAVPFAEIITLGGTGEPLLYPCLDRLLQNKGPATHVAINTNGSLIRQQYRQLQAMDEIDVSFDGASAETFESLRVGGHFEKTVQDIRFLRQQYPDKRINLNVVVSRLNLGELHGIARLAVDLGMNYLVLTPIVVSDNLRFLELTVSDYPAFQAQLQQIIADFRSKIGISCSIIPENFAPDRTGEPAAPAVLLARLKALSFRPAPIRTIGEAVKGLGLFEDFTWPQPEAGETRSFSNFSLSQLPPLQDLSATGEILRQLQKKLLRVNSVQLPYCLAPWLIAYVKSDTMLRPCCFHNLEASLANQSLAEAWNGPVWMRLRQAMLTRTDLPRNCRNCTAAMRYWHKPQLLEFARSSGFVYREKEDRLEFENVYLDPKDTTLRSLMNLG